MTCAASSQVKIPTTGGNLPTQRRGRLQPGKGECNAGLRIYDMEDPEVPREVGWFLPPEPTRRFGPIPADKLVLQSEDVLVDARGYVYLTNKNQGMWILRYTGPGAPTGA